VLELSARPGVRVSVIAVQYPHQLEEYYWHGIRVYACGGSNRLMLRPQTWYKAVEYGSRINRAEAIDSIHSFWLGECTLIGRWLERKYEKPHWVTLIGQDVRRENPYLGLYTLPMLNLIAVSIVQAVFFEINTGQPVRLVIPWGLDEKQFPPAGKVERDVDVLGVGVFQAVKNWPLFFETVKKVSEVLPNLKVWLIGSGEEKERLVEMRRTLNLGEIIKFAGPLQRPHVLEWMRRSRVLLLTSDFEAFGYALTEASASGCRIVSTPVGIAPQLPFCEIGETAEVLAAHLLAALEAPVLEGGQVLFPVKKTADAYIGLAGLKVAGPTDDLGKGGDFGGSQ
jgi:1,2-diacylglycerol 3-alpha-glucosyltransferase